MDRKETTDSTAPAIILSRALTLSNIWFSPDRAQDGSINVFTFGEHKISGINPIPLQTADQFVIGEVARRVLDERTNDANEEVLFVAFTAEELLTSLGWDCNGRNFKRLDDALDRIWQTDIQVEHKRAGFLGRFRLLTRLETLLSRPKTYRVGFDVALLNLMEGNESVLIPAELNRRLAKNHALANRIVHLISSSNTLARTRRQEWFLPDLIWLTQTNRDKPLYEFRRMLKTALEKLKTDGVIDDYAVGPAKAWLDVSEQYQSDQKGLAMAN